MKPASIAMLPTSFQAGLPLFSRTTRAMASIGLPRPRRPMAISVIITGMPMARMQTRYMSTKAPPPYSPVM